MLCQEPVEVGIAKPHGSTNLTHIDSNKLSNYVRYHRFFVEEKLT